MSVRRRFRDSSVQEIKRQDHIRRQYHPTLRYNRSLLMNLKYVP